MKRKNGEAPMVVLMRDHGALLDFCDPLTVALGLPSSAALLIARYFLALQAQFDGDTRMRREMLRSVKELSDELISAKPKAKRARK